MSLLPGCVCASLSVCTFVLFYIGLLSGCLCVYLSLCTFVLLYVCACVCVCTRACVCVRVRITRECAWQVLARHPAVPSPVESVIA